MFYIPLVIVHNSFVRFIIVDCNAYTINSVALLIYRLNTNVPSPTLLLMKVHVHVKRERETYMLGVQVLRKYTLASDCTSMRAYSMLISLHSAI